MKKLLFIFILVVIGIQDVLGQSKQDEATISTSATIVQKVKVFPNPATDVVNVLGLQNSLSAKIQLIDAYGSTILEHFWSIKNHAVNIPVTSLDTGIYSIKINSKEQHVQTKFYKK